MKKKLVLSLGSNLGNRYAYIYTAIEYISKVLEGECTCSRYYVTPPWGNTQQAPFINMALYLDTDKPISEILRLLQSIELKMGRNKAEKWGPRCIDIDILFYGDEVQDQELLTVPHPNLHERIFVLKPLVDILPDFVHPLLNKSMTELFTSMPDNTVLFN